MALDQTAEAARTTVREALADDIAKDHSVIGARVNGHLLDLHTPFVRDASTRIEPVRTSDPDGQRISRHPTAPFMADAVQRLSPGTKVTIGPAIDARFSYDFDQPTGPFTDEDLGKIADERRDVAVLEQLAEPERLAQKPMRCPSRCLLLGQRRRSDRELPWRLADSGRLHRYERGGVVHGLARVRSFEKRAPYAEEVVAHLRRRGLRAGANLGSDKLSAEIRAARSTRLPYVVVVGDKEAEPCRVAPRSRDLNKDLGALPLEEFADRLAAEAKPPRLAVSASAS